MWWQCIRRQWPCKSHHTSPCFSHQPQTTSPTLSRLQCIVSRSSFSPSLSLSHTRMHFYESSKRWQTHSNDVTATPCPPHLSASNRRQPFDPRSLFHACLRAGWGWERPVGGYSASCLSSPLLNCIVRSWQIRSCLLSFNNLCCLTKPAKSRITLKYSNGTQLRQRRLASNPIPAGIYFSN